LIKLKDGLSQEREMKKWKLILIISGLFILTMWVITTYFYPKAFGHHWTPIGFSYLRGYRLGLSQAKDDLVKGQAMILNPVDTSEERVDRSTGLFLWSMGDVTDQGTVGYINGYNSAIRKHIENSGIPKYSWKAWENAIFSAKDYFNRESAQRDPSIMVLGGDSISDYRSKATIRLRVNPSGDGFLIDIKTNSEITISAWPVSPANGALQCIWGPMGSDLLFVRGFYGRSTSPVTAVLDLRRSIFLRFEH
jgi:hypothetical protein